MIDKEPSERFQKDYNEREVKLISFSYIVLHVHDLMIQIEIRHIVILNAPNFPNSPPIFIITLKE